MATRSSKMVKRTSQPQRKPQRKPPSPKPKAKDDHELLQRLAAAFDKNTLLFTQVLMGMEETVNALAVVVGELAEGTPPKKTGDGLVDFNHYIVSYRDMVAASSQPVEPEGPVLVEGAAPMGGDVRIFGGG